MSATVIPFASRHVRRSLGPVPAVITGSQVLHGQHGALLELRLIPFSDRFYLFQIKNHTVRHTRESGYPVFQRLPGFPHSRE
ncbi:MAG: hypothetical protein RKO66_10015 [Candidatus Contendobacter sp.]|nr:hypothetical protein [Candidatus Contendobacter sp.]MDS4058990.1 hypothetical protein [Candidatus Contendobacter sp.]